MKVSPIVLLVEEFPFLEYIVKETYAIKGNGEFRRLGDVLGSAQER